MAMHNANSLPAGVMGNYSAHTTVKTDNVSPQTNNREVSTGTDTSRAEGDKRLNQAYTTQLSKGGRVEVPPASTLGGWLGLLNSILGSSAFKRLQAVAGGAGAIIHIDHNKGEIAFGGHSRITRESPELKNIPGGLELFDGLIEVAKKINPYGTLSVPGDVDVDPSGADTATSSIVKQFLFSGIKEVQQDGSVRTGLLHKIGESQTRHNMLDALKKHIESPKAKSNLETITVEIAPHSMFWSEEKPQPVTMTLTQLLAAYGLLVPTTLEELDNLQRVLAAPPLEAPSEENYGGLLSKEVPLGEDDKKKIIDVTNAWKAARTLSGGTDQNGSPRLFEYLLRGLLPSALEKIGNDPDALLKALINTPGARALGNKLQEAIGALPTGTSAQEALLTALALDVDPHAGQDRNNLAGYNLRQQDNAGRSPAEIIKRFEAHLQNRFGPVAAKVIAHQLLAMAAPEFLVKDLPPSMVYGSQQWATFSAAVSRREQDTPGSSAGQSYAQIIERGVLEPVTEAEKQQAQIAAMQSVVDWGIANGVIQESSDGQYSAQTIQRAATALQKQTESLIDATEVLATPLPTRRELALAELKRVYGEDKAHLFESKIFRPSSQRTWDNSRFSLVDIYMSGELWSYRWQSFHRELSMSDLQGRFGELAKMEDKFDSEFDRSAERLSQAVGVNFGYQMSLLPAEVRKALEHGEVKLRHVSRASISPFPDGSDEHPLFKLFGNGAVLIDAMVDGKWSTYVYSPTLGKIIKSGEPLPGVPEGWDVGAKFRKDNQGYWGTHHGLTVGGKVYELKVDHATAKSFDALPEPHPVPRVDVPSARAGELAKGISSIYQSAAGSYKEAAHGMSEREVVKAKRKAFEKVILSFIPFYNFVKSIIDGNKHDAVIFGLFDLIGLIVPPLKGGYQAVRAGTTGINATLSFLKGFAKAGAKVTNPFTSFYDAGTGLFKLGKTGANLMPRVGAPSFDFNKTRSLSGRSGSWDVPHGGYKQTIADGTYRPFGQSGSDVPIAAVKRDGKWYAFDRKTMTPFGPELKGFKPITAKGLNALKDSVVDVATTLRRVKQGVEKHQAIKPS